MDTDRCWEIVGAAWADATLDWSEYDRDSDGSIDALLGDSDGSIDALLSEPLIARLAQLSPQEIAAFEVRFSRLQGRIAGRDGIHEAALLLTLGLGDDGFGDFCAAMVGLGRHWYNLVLADPDNLADHPAVRLMAAGALDRFTFNAESVQYAAYTAYEQVTGEEDALEEELDRIWETLEDDLGPAPAPLPQPVRLPRLEALFPENHAILVETYGDGETATATP